MLGLDNSVCAVIGELLIYGISILTRQIWPRLSWSHAEAVLSGTRIIGGIVRRCLRIITHRTILGLRRCLWKNPMAVETTNAMLLHGSSEQLIIPTM